MLGIVQPGGTAPADPPGGCFHWFGQLCDELDRFWLCVVVELPVDEPLDFDEELDLLPPAAFARATPPNASRPRTDVVARASRSRCRIAYLLPRAWVSCTRSSEQAAPKTRLTAA